MLQLLVGYQTGLLYYHAPAREDDEVGYTTNIEARSQLSVFFRIDFQHYRLARHVDSGAGDFRSSSATGRAPLCPEVHEHGNRYIVNDLIE